MEEKKEEKKDDFTIFDDNGALVKFLSGILDKGSALVHHADSQTNILMGISSAIFIFSLSSSLQRGHMEIPFLILILFSAFSSLAGLYAIHPPRFMRKKQQEESVMYNKKISDFTSSDDYFKVLWSVMLNRTEFVRQYSMEIYNLYKYNYGPKRKLFKLARNLLIAGLVCSLLSFLFITSKTF